MLVSGLFSRLVTAAAIALFASTSIACAASAAAEPRADEATGASADELSRARFTRLPSGPTDARLASLYAAGKKLDNAYVGVYRFNKAGLEATEPDLRVKRVKEVMHRYMCGFFDDAIDLGRATGGKRVEATLADLDLRNNASDEAAAVAAFGGALAQVFTSAKLDVMSGAASGNNTVGEIMGVYDVGHDEVFYFGFTNCGKDD